MKRKFEFSSFEQGQRFVHEVGKFCSLKDHHPQWETADGGKSLVVTLTSHFANNKVTLFDFELAEQMNEQYIIIQKQFRMFPLITEGTWVSFKIWFLFYFVGCFVVSIIVHSGDSHKSSY